ARARRGRAGWRWRTSSPATDAWRSRWCRRAWCARSTRRGASRTSAARWRSGAAVLHRDVVALGIPDVELAGPADLGILIEHLLPVGQPSRHARDGEQDGEDLDREAHGLVDQAGVEVDVRVQAPRR